MLSNIIDETDLLFRLIKYNACKIIYQITAISVYKLINNIYKFFNKDRNVWNLLSGLNQSNNSGK